MKLDRAAVASTMTTGAKLYKAISIVKMQSEEHSAQIAKLAVVKITSNEQSGRLVARGILVRVVSRTAGNADNAQMRTIG